ncbi:MAG: lipopolysaccharide transport periplasmic protein LptA [Proteobacteria bacterium]|nr:lipopolysaccharide transport periplasmic protein LptA [Pseudomonadota bacterium]
MRSRYLCLLLFAVAPGASASDAEAPLTVEAASMEADRAREISVFRGDVLIEKGSIRIEAEEARLRAVEGEVREGTLIGAPVKFRQLPETGELIIGEARRIEYDAVARVVVLTGDAWVKQGTDEFRGQTIRYALDDRNVIATSDETTPERVKLIFQPKSETPSDTPDNTGNPPAEEASDIPPAQERN